jgi:hypothetical protein
MTGDPGDPALADALPVLPAPAPRGRRARADPRLRMELVERTGLSLRVRVRIAPLARGRLVASLRRGKGRHALHGRRQGGRVDLTARVRRPGRWRLVVRFEGSSGWADAALPARTLRFAPRSTRAVRRRA